MAVYTWDRENINSIARRLEKERENLETQKVNLKKYKGNAAAAYQGEAAQQFLANMEADIANMDLVREMIREQANKLRRIAEIHYKECEDVLRQKVTILNGEIK